MAFYMSYPYAGLLLGMATSMPFFRPSFCFSNNTFAIYKVEFIEFGDFIPEDAEKNAGNHSLPYVITGTPYVYKYSRVLGMSKMDLTPADTTVTGVWPSSLKSALASIVCSYPL